MSKKSEEEFNRLIAMSKKAMKQAQEYEKLAEEARNQSVDYEATAIEMAMPFKRGDIIEFQKTTGFRSEIPKTFRVRVDYLSLDWNKNIEVRGRQVTLKGEISRNQQWVTFGGKNAKFIRVVKEKK